MNKKFYPKTKGMTKQEIYSCFYTKNKFGICFEISGLHLDYSPAFKATQIPDDIAQKFVNRYTFAEARQDDIDHIIQTHWKQIIRALNIKISDLHNEEEKTFLRYHY